MVDNADPQLASLLTAEELKEMLAEMRIAKASEEARARSAAEAERNKLIERLTMPSGVSEAEATKRIATIVARAVANGLKEVEIYRFPNQLCSDRGRAIGQNEPGWEETLTGVPKEIYEFWDRAMRPLGYVLRVEIVDWPGGMPGDVGMTLRWA